MSRLNPQWVKKASEAARYRARKYHQVIQDIHRIDNEITKFASSFFQFRPIINILFWMNHETNL